MENPKHQFETDSTGNLVVQPVVGWSVGIPSGPGILLRLEYALGLHGSAPHDKVQVILTPQQALLLADQLRPNAEHMLQRIHNQRTTDERTPPRTSSLFPRRFVPKVRRFIIWSTPAGPKACAALHTV